MSERIINLVGNPILGKLDEENTILKQHIKKLEDGLRGIAGGSVYRHSHQHVSKELGAVRRFASALLNATKD